VKIRTEKKSLEMRAILGKNLKEPPICHNGDIYYFLLVEWLAKTWHFILLEKM
jgi:hypothetical protein